MTANAALYLANAAPLPLEFLQRMVPFAEVSTLPPGNGHAGGYVLSAPAWSLRLSVMPPEQMQRHLQGFNGWIATVSGGGGQPLEQQAPATRQLLRRLAEVKLVLGCVVEPSFDPSGYVRRTLAAIARPGRGVIFADNAVYDHDGARLVGTSRSPASFLPGELSAAQRWALATTAIVTRYFEHSHELLGGMTTADRDEAKETLLDPWGIETRTELFDMLKHLAHPEAQQGMRNLAAQIAAGSACVTDDVSEDDIEFVRAHGLETGLRAQLADYLCRLVYLAGVAYVAGLLSESEAWGYCLGAALRLQQGFGSWEELGRHYLLGVTWRRGPDEDLEQSCQELLADPASPWLALPWGQPLT
jgi:hypothetical protein